MTFKPPDCRQCLNNGCYKQVVWPSYDDGFESLDITKPNIFDATYNEVEVPCDCWHGQQYQIWKDRMAHPEYVNPLVDMTGNELISFLNDASDFENTRNELIRQEFEL